MLPSSTTAGEVNRNKSQLKLNVLVSSSSSSSTLTNTNPFKDTSTKTMEEVWKDINLASLNEHNTRTFGGGGGGGGGIIYQDFLGQPFSIDHPSNTMVSKASNITANSLYCPPSPAPSPLTALSLSSSRPHFHFDSLIRSNESQLVHPHHHHHHHHHLNPVSKVSCFSNTPFDESLVCTSTLPCFEDKGFAEPADWNPKDRRNKRMIKNRESAARSRARKQAYTQELQLKVDQLMEENARLKREQQKLCVEAAASQQTKKSNLYRTSTAPF